MLADFVNKLMDLGRKANAIEPFNVDGVRDKTFVRHGEEILEYDVPPKLRRDFLGGIADLEKFLSIDGPAESPEVYFDERGVAAWLNGDKRDHTVAMPFVKTARMRTVEKLIGGMTFTPPEAVKFLKFDLHEAGSAVVQLLKAFSKVDFVSTGRASSRTGHGESSMGREVENKINKAEDIAEVITLNVPIWRNPGLDGVYAAVNLGIHIDAESEKVELRLLADELPNAMDSAMASVGEILAAALGTIPVFYGRMS